MNALRQDVRQSLRFLVRNPVFTGVAVLTLAVALAANATMFSVVDGVLLRPLPYGEPDRIVDVSIVLPPGEGGAGRTVLLDAGQLDRVRTESRTLEHMAAFRQRSFVLTGRGEPERLRGASVSAALLPLLGVTPVHGRRFAEDERVTEPVVILSHGVWQRRFQGDPGVIGRSVVLDGLPHSVIGVMPEGFFFPDRRTGLWTPMTTAGKETPGAAAVSVEYFPVIARLRPGVAPERARAEVQSILARVDGEAGTSREPPAARVRLVPLREKLVEGVGRALAMLSAAVGLVLLMVCANLASLISARTTARRRELAIRAALGASRVRLLRQMLTESTVLGLLGGAVGLVLARALHPLVIRAAGDLPRIAEVRIDIRVVACALLASGLTGLLVGVLPALRSIAADCVRPLRGGPVVTTAHGRSMSLLVMIEVALAVVLLVGASLLLRSFVNLVTVQLGCRPEGVVMTRLDLEPGRYGGLGWSGAPLDELLSRLEAHPSIAAAGVVSVPPLPQGFSLTSVGIEGQPPARRLAIPQLTSPGYLEAIGLRLAEGRWLTRRDHAGRAPVAMVNEAFVDRFLSGIPAVGSRIEVGSASLEVVGVVEDVRLLGLGSEPRPEFFVSYHLAPAVSGSGSSELTMVIRSLRRPSELMPVVRSLLDNLDPDLPLELETMEARLSSSVAQPRFYTLLLGSFALLALLLAAAGLYGTLSFSVARQIRAIGIHRALGARSAEILRRVLGGGLLTVCAGLAMGVGTAVGTTRVLGHLLFEVTTTDPLAYAAALLVLVSVGALACYVPARRATKVDPIDVLRHD